jgi:hypothetical protein
MFIPLAVGWNVNNQSNSLSLFRFFELSEFEDLTTGAGIRLADSEMLWN